MQPTDFAKAVAQYEILQWCFGLGAIAFLTFQMLRTWRRDMRADDKLDDPHQAATENAFASVPKYYWDGPIRKLFDLLHEINGRMKDIQRRFREIDDGERAPPKRRR